MSDFQNNGIELDNDVSTPTDTSSEDFDTNDDFDFFGEEQESEPTSEEPVTEVQNQEQTPQTLKVKYNHEERELSYDEAIELAQKGMNYEKAVERAKQEALDSYIAEQGYEWNGQPITTYEQYQQALKEQELIEQYQDADLPDEVIQELIENRKFREQYMAQQEQIQQEQKQQQEFVEFAEQFPDVDPESIPSEVWQQYESGVPLKYAYMEHEMKQLRTLANVQKQNTQNQTKPTLGVTAFGSGEPEKSVDPFLAGFDSL